MIKTLFLDMYGVIIEEGSGNFLAYLTDLLGEDKRDSIEAKLFGERLFVKATHGEVPYEQLFLTLGVEDPLYHMKRYLDNWLTLDPRFIPFAEKYSSKYDFILLSNDIAAWSEHFMAHHDLDRYFKAKLVSGDLDCRKPQKGMYRMGLTASWNEAEECLLVDNTPRNLRSAREFFSIPTVLFEREKAKWDGDRVSSFPELGAYLDNLES